METVAEKKFSVEEYFALEEKSEIRHEFYYGEIIEMPGETTIANLIAGNIYGSTCVMSALMCSKRSGVESISRAVCT